MSGVVAALNVQTVVDAIGLGAVYALMAVGIGLVFGVLRLVNFAYGQLIMAGAFALALASEWDWPVWAGIVLCFAVVVALSMLMELLVFRPLRTQSPAVMLVATFAVAFLLQSVALLSVRATRQAGDVARYPQPAGLDRGRRRAQDHDRRDRRRGRVPPAAAGAARADERRAPHASSGDSTSGTARLLGVRANRVIGSAVLVSGLLAAVVAVMLTVQNPLVTPGFALHETIVVLAGVVVGGMNRLLSATLGGFAIGFASGLLGGALPTDQSQYLPSFLFGLVILVLLIVGPSGLFTRGRGPVERV